MKKKHLVSTCCLLPGLLLTGCDFSENDQPYVVDEPGNTAIIAPETSTEIIDLNISPAMLEALQQQEKDTLTQTEIPPTSFTNSSKEDDVSFSGKLHLDKNTDENTDEKYLDAIDGAEMNIEVKFE